MRGGRESSDRNSRFNMDYEALSIYEGISEEIVGTVGTTVDWMRWQDYYLEENYTTIVDDIYDVSSSVAGGGRRWMLPFKMPVLMAQFVRGTNVMNERGYYVTDTLRIVMNVGDVKRLLPDLITNANNHIKDRIIYRGEVFVPTRVLPRGSFGNRWTVVTVDCNQVNSEELVNDPQFQRYASVPSTDLRFSTLTAGYGTNGYGSNLYGA
jgi:hypothetical protein